MECMSLIDAVMPDMVESRKQAIAKSNQVKAETSSATNGDDGAHPVGEAPALPVCFNLAVVVTLLNPDNSRLVLCLLQPNTR